VFLQVGTYLRYLAILPALPSRSVGHESLQYQGQVCCLDNYSKKGSLVSGHKISFKLTWAFKPKIYSCSSPSFQSVMQDLPQKLARLESWREPLRAAVGGCGSRSLKRRWYVSNVDAASGVCSIVPEGQTIPGVSIRLGLELCERVPPHTSVSVERSPT
jgi:hypothetical protein